MIKKRTVKLCHELMMDSIIQCEHERARVGVAEAQFKQALRLGQTSGAKAKLAHLQQLQNRFQDSEEVTVQYFVAYAMLHQGMTLGEMGQTTAELCLYDDLVEHLTRFGMQPVLAPLNMQALINKAVTLTELDRTALALALYDEIIQRFQKVQVYDLVLQLAQAMVNKITLLGDLELYADQLQAYDQMIAHFQYSQYESLQLYVAKLMLNKAGVLASLGRYERAIQTYQAMINWLSPLDSDAFNGYLLKALVYQGAAYGIVNKPWSQVKVYQYLITRFNDLEDAKTEEYVAQAWLNLALVYAHLRRYKAEAQTYEHIIERFDASMNGRVQGYLAQAMLNRMMLLQCVDLERVEGLSVFIDRFIDEHDERIAICVAIAMLNKGIMLGQLGRLPEAYAVYDQLITRYQYHSEPRILDCLTQAIMYKEQQYGCCLKQ